MNAKVRIKTEKKAVKESFRKNLWNYGIAITHKK